MRYDLALLEQLNQEYRAKPLLRRFNQYDPVSQQRYAAQRLGQLSAVTDLQGKAVLEIGCGYGYIAHRLATHYGCTVTAVDILPRLTWQGLEEGSALKFLEIDLSAANPFPAESFDLAVSFVAWEHMRHPYRMLKETVRLLKPSGRLFIRANQYRSAVGSHLYRVIFFPYPHLLFTDEVILEFCLRRGALQEGADSLPYLNKLTLAQYLLYFQLLYLQVDYLKLDLRPLDLDFYHRFEDKLGCYPQFDLELDFFNVLLSKRGAPG